MPEKIVPGIYSFDKIQCGPSKLDIIGNKQIASENPLLGGVGVGKTLFPIMSIECRSIFIFWKGEHLAGLQVFARTFGKLLTCFQPTF